MESKNVLFKFVQFSEDRSDLIYENIEYNGFIVGIRNLQMCESGFTDWGLLGVF